MKKLLIGLSLFVMSLSSFACEETKSLGERLDIPLVFMLKNEIKVYNLDQVLCSQINAGELKLIKNETDEMSFTMIYEGLDGQLTRFRYDYLNFDNIGMYMLSYIDGVFVGENDTQETLYELTKTMVGN